MGVDTERKIFTLLGEISTDVAVIKSQLPAADRRLVDHERRAGGHLNDLEKRLRIVETRVWLAVGVLSFIAVVLPMVLPYVFPSKA